MENWAMLRKLCLIGAVVVALSAFWHLADEFDELLPSSAHDPKQIFPTDPTGTEKKTQG